MRSSVLFPSKSCLLLVGHYAIQSKTTLGCFLYIMCIIYVSVLALFCGFSTFQRFQLFLAIIALFSGFSTFQRFQYFFIVAVLALFESFSTFQQFLAFLAFFSRYAKDMHPLDEFRKIRNVPNFFFTSKVNIFTS